MADAGATAPAPGTATQWRSDPSSFAGTFPIVVKVDPSLGLQSEDVEV